MNAATLTRLTEKLQESPILRAATLPSSKEIDVASNELGVPFAAEYREFLLRFGGAMVGPYPIYGLRRADVMGDDEWSVTEITKRFRADNVPGCDAWVVVSSDHAGNPIGMDASGVIWIYDHDFGGISPVAKNLEEYILVRCLGLQAI